jgi:hypothetical protein
MNNMNIHIQTPTSHNIRIFDNYPDSYLNICTYSDNIGFNLWKGFFMEKKGSKLSDFTKMKIQITKVL